MLCKKVAQLTKVVYHLNTKNEDQETRLQELQQRYEAERSATQTPSPRRQPSRPTGRSAADRAISARWKP